ncbi:MAG TPA: hypothetical protein VF846_11485 [Thermoanaerobaculia bacterium]|jgi:hypothetical protein
MTSLSDESVALLRHNEPAQEPLHVAADEPATAPPVEAEAAAPQADEIAPAVTAKRERSLLLLLAFSGFGALLLAFTFLTVHSRPSAELPANSMSARAHFETTYWLEHGYFHSAGLRVRTAPDMPVYFYRSSTGGVLLPGFIAQKIYASITGRYSWRLMTVVHQTLSALASAFLALLGFRLARRIGIGPLHALALGASLQAVHFTFPDNLMTYWELSSRVLWLLAVCVFLLVEERGVEKRTLAATVIQCLAAFFMTYVEIAAGATFLLAYALLALLISDDRGRSAKRLLLVMFVPMLLAYGVYAMQLQAARAMHPKVPVHGSELLFRTGLDGASTYYGDHLDIAFGREIVRGNFPVNRPFLFRWKWLFFTGVVALLSVLVAAVRGRLPLIATLSVSSLLGAYLIYAALFSQAVVIHPYYYDVMLFTPLVLALFVLAPALVETMSVRQGVVVAAVCLLALWISMMQMRRYALQFPLPPVTQQGA